MNFYGRDDSVDTRRSRTADADARGGYIIGVDADSREGEHGVGIRDVFGFERGGYVAASVAGGGAFAWNEYADRLDASISDEIVRRMVVDAPVDARGFRDEAAGARRRGSAPRGSTSSSSCARGAFD